MGVVWTDSTAEGLRPLNIRGLAELLSLKVLMAIRDAVRVRQIAWITTPAALRSPRERAGGFKFTSSRAVSARGHPTSQNSGPGRHAVTH